MAFGSKNSTPSFVLTSPLDISLNEQDYLYKEFKKCGVIYNQLVSATTKMWYQLRKTRKYRELMAATQPAACYRAAATLSSSVLRFFASSYTSLYGLRYAGLRYFQSSPLQLRFPQVPFVQL